MFWDIGKGSSRFSDVNYNPEIFYRWKMSDSNVKEIDFCAIEHKSDGQNGADARSQNRFYLNLKNEIGFLHQNFRAETKIYVFYDYNETNSEIFRQL